MKPLTDEQIRSIYSQDSYCTKRDIAGAIIVHSDERYRTHTNTLADVLTDLMHYAAREGIDFDLALQAAKETWQWDTGVTY